MRVAFTHAYSWPEVRRGGERMLHELSRAVAGRGHDVTVFTAGTLPGLTDDRNLRVQRLRRRANSAARHETDFACRLVPRLWRGRFDVVHSLGPRDALAAIWARRLGGRHRCVYTHLGIPDRNWLASQPEGRSHRRVVRQIDAYGCLSRHALAVLERDFGRRGVLTPGGVDLSQFRPAAARAEQPTVLFSGAVEEPRKNAPLLVDAVERISARVPDIRLVLSGPGNTERLLAGKAPQLRARVQSLPLGRPQDQGSRYAEAWVTAVPSRWEAFGLVVLESLASGTPVVVSDEAGLPELVEPGKTGVLVKPGDVDALAAGLAEGLAIAQDPHTSERCRVAAAAHDWDGVVSAQLEALYASLRGASE